MKKILITGAKSYIGESFKDFLSSESNNYIVEIKDTIGWEPTLSDFLGYDVVFNVAGIAHIKETSKNKHLYYDINRDLVIKIAKFAKEAKVKQFILLSSMSVYGLLTGYITKTTPEKPSNSYGDSKAQADKIIRALEDKNFKFVCLRPPMVYGKNCKGNYQTLRKFALITPIFPDYGNERSMIYIGNLCYFIKEMIDKECRGLFFPQNYDYVRTSEMVRLIAECHERTVKQTKIFNWILKFMKKSIIRKVFGDLTYEKVDLVNNFSFYESIKMTER